MCEICLNNPCDYRCPNYITTKHYHKCIECGSSILDDEEYIQNEEGTCMHYECVQGIRSLLEFLGYKIKTMEDMDYENW